MDIPANLFPGRRPRGRVTEASDCAAQEFAGGKDSEGGDDVGIAAPQAAWFRAQPKQPFKSVSLHPEGRPTLGPCQEVKRRSDPDHHRRLDTPEMARHPELL